MAAAFNTADFGGANLVWTTVVNDNGIDATPAVGEAKDFYDPAVVPLQPRYDLNNDGKLWVRAQAIVRGQRRTLVQLVRHDQKVEQLPRSAVTAGRFRTGNNGNKTIVDTDGGTDGVPIASPPGIVQVRCGTTANHGTEGDGCLDFVPDRDQVYPNTAVGGYSGGNALSSDAQARLKERAQASGTYFTSCPTDAQLTGTVVYVDLATHVDCGPYNTGNWNSPGNYGILMWTRGSFKFTGSNIFYGILYAMNLDNSNRTDLVDLKGCNAILGAVLVDGAGGVDAGSCKNNIIFDERAFTAATSFGNAGVVQNSFREVQSPAF